MYIIFGVLIIVSIATMDFSEEIFNFFFIYSFMLIDIIYVVILIIGSKKMANWYEASYCESLKKPEI